MKTSTARLHPDLPIFRLDRGAQSYIYTPGHPHAVTRGEADELQIIFASTKPRNLSSSGRLARVVEGRAKRSQREWQKLSEVPFEPVCLTVYLSNRCNLRCSYCFAAPARAPRSVDDPARMQDKSQDAELPVIREEAVEQAARAVVGHCARRNRPFTLVLHGGGEPTLHWRLLQRLVSLTQRVAVAQGVRWWGYIATNGVLSENRAKWLAGHFDLVGLSCDGPPVIQDAQRPTTYGAGTSKVLERTACLLKEIGTPYSVRATITPEIVQYQSEIVRYIHSTLGANVLHFEPVYDPRGSTKSSFLPADAERFVTGFLAAQRLAAELGCELSLSGVRPEEIHGPYCNVLRDVLQLTPNGVVSACFLCTDGNAATGAAMSLARLNSAGAPFTLELDRIAGLRRRALTIPARCRQCINIYHCVRECPEGCPVIEEEDDPLRSEGFRCQVYKRLVEDWIFRSGIGR